MYYKRMLLYFTYFCGFTSRERTKKGVTQVQFLSCKYFQWYTFTAFTNNMRSNAMLRKEIIKGFPRSAHIKWKHNNATGSIKTRVTENGIPWCFYPDTANLWHFHVYAKMRYLKHKRNSKLPRVHTQHTDLSNEKQSVSFKLCPLRHGGTDTERILSPQSNRNLVT
jgi:hypothetical protein